jgi:MFS transporter, PPP family, 3-phenylpropionic acid transporter
LEIGCIPWLIWFLLLALWWSSLSVPGAPSVLDEAEERFWPIVWRREVLAFFGVVMLLQLSHGPYYAFFSIHLASQGFASDRIGQLWVLAVLAEIALFLFAHRLFRRYTSRRILLTSLLLAAVRWVLIAAAAGNLIVLVVAQTLHAASFGAVHAVGVQLTHRYFTGRHGSKGQGLYSSASFGLGGALGAWGAGASWIPLGPAAVYAAAAGCCLLAAWIGWMWVDREPVRRWTRADSPLL